MASNVRLQIVQSANSCCSACVFFFSAHFVDSSGSRAACPITLTHFEMQHMTATAAILFFCTPLLLFAVSLSIGYLSSTFSHPLYPSSGSFRPLCPLFATICYNILSNSTPRWFSYSFSLSFGNIFVSIYLSNSE